MAFATIVGLEVVYAVAMLILVSLGLAIVFGMMRVINLAHGEFMVMGGYAATFAVHHGINFWIAIIVVPPVIVGIIGVVVERTIIRFLYGRMFETLLATWGLSLPTTASLATSMMSSRNSEKSRSATIAVSESGADASTRPHGSTIIDRPPERKPPGCEPI